MIEDEVIPEDADPPEHLRTYYRHTKTGDLGYMVRDNGKDAIRLDRPNERIIRPFAKDAWIPEDNVRKMSVAQVAQICFEADRKLCFFLGDHGRARKEWLSLKDEERVAWMRRGPRSPEVRVQLYLAMRDVLNQYAVEED